eukprot:m.571280 g.571280  ORF g.571280 m.571280 type:complete len:102 (+) comp57856_c0_seq9:593-898(+)
MALYCFTACLHVMSPTTHFPSFPACLHKIAELYSSLGQFDKGLFFLHAEKKFYENQLLGGSKRPSETIEHELSTPAQDTGSGLRNRKANDFSNRVLFLRNG